MTKAGDPPFAWKLAVGLVTGLLRLFGWRVEATLPDDIPPPDRPLVVVSNHTSNVDPFLVGDTVWKQLRHWIQPLGKAEAFDIPIVGRVGRAAGAIPVARSDDAGREEAYDAAIERLASGGTIYVAAEGTVSHDGSLLPLRFGAARLARQSGADVLVVTHAGAQRAFSPVAKLPHRGVIVTMAMDVMRPWDGEDDEAFTGRMAATILDRSTQLQDEHPQRDTTAAWWPPYRKPAVPTATARDNIERYRHSMADAVASARERMARFAEEHHLEQRAAEAREKAKAKSEELAEKAHHRLEEFRHRHDDTPDAP